VVYRGRIALAVGALSALVTLYELCVVFLSDSRLDGSGRLVTFAVSFGPLVAVSVTVGYLVWWFVVFAMALVGQTDSRAAESGSTGAREKTCAVAPSGRSKFRKGDRRR
jgi:hypothetical protein